jgi:hypothetical protein
MGWKSAGIGNMKEYCPLVWSMGITWTGRRIVGSAE